MANMAAIDKGYNEDCVGSIYDGRKWKKRVDIDSFQQFKNTYREMTPISNVNEAWRIRRTFLRG